MLELFQNHINWYMPPGFAVANRIKVQFLLSLVVGSSSTENNVKGCVNWDGMHETHPKAILGWRREPLFNRSGK
jgi:hypothetical protein